MATFAIDCTVWILSLQTLPDSPADSGLQELARSLEEVIRDAHYTDEVGTSSESHASSVPKAEAPERPISNSWASMQWIPHRWLGLMPSRLMGTALNPKSHTLHRLARCTQF